MNDILKKHYSIFNNSSKLSPQVRTGLIISIVIVLTIAIIILVLSFLYKKKVTKKYFSPKEELEIQKIKEKNPNYGIVLHGIKKYYQNDLNDFFVCFITNTIYLNDYKNIYIDDLDNYLALSIINLANTKVFLKGDIDKKINDKLANEFPELNFSDLNSVSELNKNYDLQIILNENYDPLDLINKHTSFLNENGILIVSYNNKNKLKILKDEAKKYNLRYETLKFKNKSVILLAKNIIKEMLNNK